MPVPLFPTAHPLTSASSGGKRRSSIVTVLSKAEAKRLHALAAPRQRAESGLFLVEGVRLVEDLLDSSVVPRTAVVSSSLEDTDRGQQLARRLHATVRTVVVPDHQLRAIASTESPQGVLVAAEIPRSTLGEVTLGERELVVVLDGVQDPGNFGSIVRSADAFGVAFVCALPGTVDPWNPKSVRSAAGSSLRVPVIETDVDAAADWLRREGFQLLGADMGGDSIEGVRPTARTALVFGNEGAGLQPGVRALLDGMVAVPIRGSAESLNVGVAAGILLYLLSRGR
jgi:RNA methyltransferase, TrmH family